MNNTLFNETEYRQGLAFKKELGATRGIDAALREHNLDALVLPFGSYVTSPSGASRILSGYRAGLDGSSFVAAFAGYPIVTGTVIPLFNLLCLLTISSPFPFSASRLPSSGRRTG